MKFFVTHYTPLKERKNYIISQFNKHHIENFEFIENFDREILSENNTKKFDKSKLKMGNISLILKHIDAWKRIIIENLSFGIILEDDAIFISDFNNILNQYINELPDDFDILMINCGCNLHIPFSMIESNKHIYFRGTMPTAWGGNGGTRCTDGYIISNECAKKFINLYNNLPDSSINLPIDWWMNTLLRNINAKVYWAEPELIKQGTETGLFKSSYENSK